MGERCPFCWGRNLTEVRRNSTRRPSGGKIRLIECRDCERWFWEDRPEESTVLLNHCSTPWLRPRRCCEEIREIVFSGGNNGSFRRRISEFNHLCAECPAGHFDRHPIPVRGGRAAAPASPGWAPPIREREKTRM